MNRSRWTEYVFVTLLALGLAVPSLAQELERGIELLEEGEPEQARAVLAGVVEREPGNSAAMGYLGLVLVQLEDFDAAERLLEAALAADPPADVIFPSDLKVGLARVYVSRRDTTRAMQTLAEAESLSPQNPKVFFERGVLLLSNQNFNPAVEALERALALDPGNALAHYYAGLAYNGLRRSDKVVEHFQLFLRMAPDAPEAARVRSLMRALR